MRIKLEEMPNGKVRVRATVTAHQGEPSDHAKERAFRELLANVPDTHRSSDQSGTIQEEGEPEVDRFHIDPEANRGDRREGSRRIFLSLICEER